MSGQLFSQIPQQVLSRAKIDHYGPHVLQNERKKVRFSNEIEERALVTICNNSKFTTSDTPKLPEFSDDDTLDLDVEDLSDEPPSSSVNSDLQIRKKEVSDAKTQTEPQLVSRETQTDDSMVNALIPNDDQHKLISQNYYAMYSMPKNRKSLGAGPPLKLGLGLRGKKRKVFYPSHQNDRNLSDSE